MGGLPLVRCARSLWAALMLVLRCRVCRRIDNPTTPVIRATGICTACKPADSRQVTTDAAETAAISSLASLTLLGHAVRDAQRRDAAMARLDAALGELQP